MAEPFLEFHLEPDPWAEPLELVLAMRHQSSCRRRQVVAALFPRGAQLPTAVATNDGPADVPSCTDGGCPRGASDRVAPYSDYDTVGAGYCIAVHAEEWVASYTEPSLRKGATCVVTDEPCAGCVRRLAAYGVALVVWPTGRANPLELLRERTAASFAQLDSTTEDHPGVG